MQKDVIQIAYLAGTSYCGSTLLAFLMNSHPQIASVGEASLNRSVQKKGGSHYLCSCGALLSDCSFWKQVFQMVNEQGIEFSPLKWTNDYKYKNTMLHKAFSLYSANKLIRWLQNVALHVSPGYRKHINYTNNVNIVFLRSIMKLKGAEVYFDASKNLMRLSHLLTIPKFDMKIVRIVRDVRAFANSYKRRGVSVEDAARNWKNYQLSADHLMRDISSHRIIFLRYENFCHNPAHWLKYLHNFLGVRALDPPDAILPNEHHIIGNHMRLQKIEAISANESWKENLTEAEISSALRIAGDINERFGYKREINDSSIAEQEIKRIAEEGNLMSTLDSRRK